MSRASQVCGAKAVYLAMAVWSGEIYLKMGGKEMEQRAHGHMFILIVFCNVF